MIAIIFLSIWVATGLLSAWRYAEPHNSPLKWAPTAVIFGPLWLPVAMEVRQTEMPATS